MNKMLTFNYFCNKILFYLYISLTSNAIFYNYIEFALIVFRVINSFCIRVFIFLTLRMQSLARVHSKKKTSTRYTHYWLHRRELDW